MKSLKPILLVEDDQVDFMTASRAFEEMKILNPLVHAKSGEDALGYLHNQSNEKPCIILLDLNMPKMNGLEFLQAREEDESIKRIPVVVLTTSSSDEDITSSFKMSIAGYIVKPVGYKKFVEVVRAIDLYWTLSELPSGGQNNG